jgi:hypothetical protein
MPSTQNRGPVKDAPNASRARRHLLVTATGYGSAVKES